MKDFFNRGNFMYILKNNFLKIIKTIQTETRVNPIKISYLETKLSYLLYDTQVFNRYETKVSCLLVTLY